jgi:hypothetical protein
MVVFIKAQCLSNHSDLDTRPKTGKIAVDATKEMNVHTRILSVRLN